MGKTEVNDLITRQTQNIFQNNGQILSSKKNFLFWVRRQWIFTNIRQDLGMRKLQAPKGHQFWMVKTILRDSVFLWRKTDSVHKIKCLLSQPPNLPCSPALNSVYLCHWLYQKRKGMSTFLYGKHISITCISHLSALKSCNTVQDHYVFFLWELLILILIKVLFSLETLLLSRIQKTSMCHLSHSQLVVCRKIWHWVESELEMLTVTPMFIAK